MDTTYTHARTRERTNKQESRLRAESRRRDIPFARIADDNRMAAACVLLAGHAARPDFAPLQRGKRPRAAAKSATVEGDQSKQSRRNTTRARRAVENAGAQPHRRIRTAKRI